MSAAKFKRFWIASTVIIVALIGSTVYIESTRGERVVQQFIDECKQRGGKLIISKSARTFCVPVDYSSGLY